VKNKTLKIIKRIIFILFVLEKNQEFEEMLKNYLCIIIYKIMHNYVSAIFLHFSKLVFFLNKQYENYLFNYF